MITKRFFAGLASSLILLAGATQSQATLLVYDGFATPGDYSNGSSLTSQTGGGSGWTSNYTSGGTSLVSQSGGLTFGSLQTASGQAVVANAFNFNVNARSFSPINSGDLWVSWLYSPGAPSTDYSGLGLSQAGGESFYIGTDGNGLLRVDTSLIGGSNATYGSLSTGTQFFAVNINYSTGSVSVYQNPTPGGSLGSAISTFTGTPGQATGIVFLGNGNGVTSFDEIRVGTTFADVAPVPEPSTYALLLGGCALLWVLRRKSLLRN